MTAESIPTHVDTLTAAIASGGSLSAEVDLTGWSLVGIVMPAAWDAAALTFQAAPRAGGTPANLYDATGDEKEVAAAASRFVALDPAEWIGVGAVRVRSGTSGTPVNQSAARSLTLVVRALG